MANPFLATKDFDTAILLEKAMVTDIGNAVAYTNEKKELFINTEDNLCRILPAYNEDMLKWILWHEEYHGLLEHPYRYFNHILTTEDAKYITHAEVNIIMDILVHDIMATKFPDLIDTAKANLAQFRERNSLGYTFETHTLEDMIDEYIKYKKSQESEQDPGDSSSGGKGEEESKEESKGSRSKKDSETTEKKESKATRGGHSTKKEEAHEEERKDSETPTKAEGEKEGDKKTPSKGKSEQEEADWSGLDDIDTTEFIDEMKTRDIKDVIEKLKRKKIKLGRLTQTLNGLASTVKQRTYRLPSYIQVQQGVILKGKQPGFAKLYLIFDASGSMSYELQTFKDIISKSIPQAMITPTEWFSGYAAGEYREQIRKCLNPEGRNRDYYKGQFRDMEHVYASDGYNDDGYRTLELCIKAEQAGYSPIGITDGGGNFDNETMDLARQLKRTTLVSDNLHWLQAMKSANPSLQILDI